MEMKKCERGHYYDASIHAECPYCQNMSGGNSSVTMPLEQGSGSDGGFKTLPVGNYGATSPTVAHDSGKTMPLGKTIDADPDDGRTVPLIMKEMGIDPVCGWLVCISGPEKGRDYRIHSDNNHVGRSPSMDICINGDETISRDNIATISYDSQENEYFFTPGDGRSIVRVNSKAVYQTTKLNAYDVLVLGNTELVFVPLCGERFKW